MLTMISILFGLIGCGEKEHQYGGLRWTEVDSTGQGWTGVWSQFGHCLVIVVGRESTVLISMVVAI